MAYLINTVQSFSCNIKKSFLIYIYLFIYIYIYIYVILNIAHEIKELLNITNFYEAQFEGLDEEENLQCLQLYKQGTQKELNQIELTWSILQQTK